LVSTTTALVVLSVLCLGLLSALISRNTREDGGVGVLLLNVGATGGAGARRQKSPPSVQDDDVIQFSSPVRFVFFVGLEGTAHHLMRKILRSSPAWEAFGELNLWKTMRELQDALYTDRGLFNLHCGADGGPDVDRTHGDVVRRLREISDAVGNSTVDGPLSIALNAFAGDLQMASYPQVSTLFDELGIGCAWARR